MQETLDLSKLTAEELKQELQRREEAEKKSYNKQKRLF